MSWSCSYNSSLWLSSLLPPWTMPYHCLRQVGVTVVSFREGKWEKRYFKIMLIECHHLFFARVKIRDFKHLLTCFATLTVFYHLISSKIISPRARAALLFLSSFSESSHVFHRVLELLCDAVLLLGDSICELVWDDRSLVGMELASQNTTHDSLLCR